MVCSTKSSAYRKPLHASGVARRLIPPNWFRRVQNAPSRPQVRASRVIFTRPGPLLDIRCFAASCLKLGDERTVFFSPSVRPAQMIADEPLNHCSVNNAASLLLRDGL